MASGQRRDIHSVQHNLYGVVRIPQTVITLSLLYLSPIRRCLAPLDVLVFEARSENYPHRDKGGGYIGGLENGRCIRTFFSLLHFSPSIELD